MSLTAQISSTLGTASAPHMPQKATDPGLQEVTINADKEETSEVGNQEAYSTEK